MVKCKEFYDLLIEKKIGFFTGVPDSLLKDFCAYIMDNSEKHIITANEGGSIALAAGYYLSTGNIPLVYMQNSGWGNAINPLTSLVDPNVYSIPMLLLVGWRGGPGIKDEPQHIRKGRITIPLLDAVGVPYSILPDSLEELKMVLENALYHMKNKNAPYALIVKKGIFEKYELKNKLGTFYDLNREEALKLVVNELNSQDIIISTTGMLSRELFEYREFLKQGHEKDFLTVGSMGHSSKIALGIALNKSERNVYCLDGDGAVIMHMGALAIIGQKKPKNFKHIIFNNGAHDSVGGQPTAGFDIDFPAIAKACGYKTTLKVEKKNEVKEKMNLLKSSEGPAILEIRINKGSRKDLGRPTTTPIENKEKFMGYLKE